MCSWCKKGVHILNTRIFCQFVLYTHLFHPRSRVVIMEVHFCKSLPDLVFYTPTLALYALLPSTGKLLQVCPHTEPGDGVSVMGSCSEPLGPKQLKQRAVTRRYMPFHYNCALHWRIFFLDIFSGVFLTFFCCWCLMGDGCCCRCCCGCFPF